MSTTMVLMMLEVVWNVHNNSKMLDSGKETIMHLEHNECKGMAISGQGSLSTLTIKVLSASA